MNVSAWRYGSGSGRCAKAVHRRSQPWEYSGWFATVADWIEAMLPETAGVNQFATWSVSSLHRVETAAGRYYFKAAPTIFRHEASVTDMLADASPEPSPARSPSTAERGWLLTADFGDELVASGWTLSRLGMGLLDALGSPSAEAAWPPSSSLLSVRMPRPPAGRRCRVEVEAARLGG